MKEFVKRMLVEYEELNERTTKLLNFLLSDTYKNVLDDENRELLTLQYHAMVIYQNILKKRIDIQEKDE